MTQFKKQVNIYELNGRKHLSLALCFGVVMLAFIYLYLINARVYEGYVISRIATATHAERAELQSLESEYLRQTGTMDKETPAHLGFVSAEARFLRVPSGMAMADVFVR